LQCVAVCCSVLQCVTLCCRVLQCVACDVCQSVVGAIASPERFTGESCTRMIEREMLTHD